MRRSDEPYAWFTVLSPRESGEREKERDKERESLRETETERGEEEMNDEESLHIKA
jgi:hypothetical protein